MNANSQVLVGNTHDELGLIYSLLSDLANQIEEIGSTVPPMVNELIAKYAQAHAIVCPLSDNREAPSSDVVNRLMGAVQEILDNPSEGDVK